MAVILRNDHGAIAVNKNAIEHLLVEELLNMSDKVLLCTKKGKLIKDRPTPFIDPDFYDAVDIAESKGNTSIKVYVLLKKGVRAAEAAEKIFDMTEDIYVLLRLRLPNSISVKVRGIIEDGETEKRSIDIVRNND